MASATRTVRSGNQSIDGLLADYQWSPAEPLLSYGFPALGGWSGYPEGSEPDDNYEPLNAAQQQAAAAVLASAGRFTGSLHFSESGAPDSAELRFGLTDATEAAHAYTPYFDSAAGDVWFNNSSGAYNRPIAGNYAWFTFLHEIGHALGLKHPHEAEHFGAMPLDHDNMNYTVMSYRSYYNMSLEGGGYTNEDYGFPQTYMMYDIAALQHMYGADFSTESGDTVYQWDAATGRLTVNGAPRLTPGGNVVFMTVWDGGGDDTYDLSDYTRGTSIDLNPGQWTTTSATQIANLGDGNFAPGNIANALLYNGDTRSLIENAIGGSDSDRLIGNQAANILTGGAGDDVLDGRAGADRMIGGAGRDQYVVDHPGDIVVEAPGEGEDEVDASAASYTLPANVEHLTGISTSGGQTLTGNDLDNIVAGTDAGGNVLDGGAGADRLIGRSHNDTFIVDNPGDLIDEFSGVDTVISSISYVLQGDLEHLTLTGAALKGTGNDLANMLVGNSAANILNGLGGADVMKGGGGNDTYVVDAAADRAVEDGATGGSDLVISTVSYTIGAHIEKLTLAGAAAINATGNALANILTGNSAANLLDGAGGADVMKGWGGNDTYFVDASGDKAVEGSAAGGTDLVRSSVTFSLGAHLENLVLIGTAAVNATGNALANILIGNAAANVLGGGAGADTMTGWAGNDIYWVDNVADKVIEPKASGGTDTVNSAVSFALGAHVEHLTLTGTGATNGTGNALANVLTGNAAANVLRGGAGADTVRGGGGNDSLYGGVGSDTLRGGDGGDRFIFDKPLGPSNVDHVGDFVRGADKIVLENAVFKGLTAGPLAPGAFVVGAGAADAGDRIIYNPATGALLYDPDGTGAAAAMQFAVLDTLPATLAASDFTVI